MSIVVAVACLFSLMVLIQAGYTVYLMIYTWDQPDANKKARAPEMFFAPRHAFTVLLPARHEEEVIQETIERVVRANYPKELMEILVICESGDLGTIAKASEKVESLRKEGISNARVVTFDDRPINKPHGLNVGLRQSCNQVVTIFDAEDEVHPDIFNVVNTVIEHTNVRVVQSGVQLMNYASSWYSTLNVLEYFFWFKSRLHYHAQLGMIPLGGNTVFFRRDLLEEIGGLDESNLTEDADIGIRISTLGEPVRVVCDDRYVTKEETPPTLAHFIRQRTRWSQGFLQTLRKGTWTKLPTWHQRLLALYTLAFPTFQAVLTGYVLLSLWMMLAVRVTAPVAMLLISPAYLLVAHYIISLVGLYEFADAHGLHPSKMAALSMALSYIPYQWVLGYAAVRAALREMRGINNWEKTAHVGAHRQGSGAEQQAEAMAHRHSEAA